MKQFINLTSRVINTLHIVEIVKNPKNYNIYMCNNIIDGIIIAGSGSIWNKFINIEICEKNNKQDYDTITKFINEIK